MGTQLNALINAPYSDTLRKFCLDYEQEWTKRQIFDWVPANDLSLVHVKELQPNIDFMCDYVQTMWNNALGVPTKEMPKNNEFWALDYLKCILHDLLVVLRTIKSYIAALLDGNILEENTKTVCKTIVRGIQRINRFIEKAFPLLKENKSYLVIDWDNEFRNL